jgi:hypothetical protein
MPALITHHLFGEQAATRLPEGIVSGQEELIAFLLGNQGPDPLFSRFRTLPHKASQCHDLAFLMHDAHVTRALFNLRDGVSHLWREDEKVGRAFALGMLAHYVLDSTAHPFIYAQEKAIIAHADGLDGAASEVHSVIESDLDSWMLWQERHCTIDGYPSASALVLTDRVARVSSALVAQTALQTFGIALGAEEYARAVRDYHFLYAGLEPYGNPLMRLSVGVEHLARPYSKLLALSHPLITSDDCPAANLDRRVWHDPSTGEASTQSFADLYHDALNKWPDFAEGFVRGNQEQLRGMVGGINYNGVPIQDD